MQRMPSMGTPSMTVAVNGEAVSAAGHKVTVEWYAQLRLLLWWGDQQLACVRWLRDEAQGEQDRSIVFCETRAAAKPCGGKDAATTSYLSTPSSAARGLCRTLGGCHPVGVSALRHVTVSSGASFIG
jgi:hypothetical protein